MKIYMVFVIPDRELLEPLCAGILVSLINKFIINNKSIHECCYEKCCCEEREEIDARQNSENGINTTTAISGGEGLIHSESGQSNTSTHLVHSMPIHT
jgi:hypothetical protein